MNTKEAKEGLIYLYCVTNPTRIGLPIHYKEGPNKTPKLKEVEDFANNIFSVYHEGLYAIVSKVKESEFSEENLKRNLADLEWIKVKASIHEKVIEGIMKNAGVIPFKFATIFNTEDNLKTMLGQHLEEFKALLIKLEDKEEWGVKIYCDLEKLKEVIIQEDGEISKLDKEINGSTTLTIDTEQGRNINSLGPGKAYLLKKKKEELLNIAVNKKLNEYSEASFDRLRENFQEARINKLLPKEVTERNDEMILNSAFLINKNKVADFLNKVEGLKTKYTDKGLFFDCTGPWPPYNFCK